MRLGALRQRFTTGTTVSRRHAIRTYGVLGSMVVVTLMLAMSAWATAGYQRGWNYYAGGTGKAIRSP